MTEWHQAGLLIDGQEIPSATDTYFDVYAPATGEVIGRAARGGAADVEHAVHVARRGFHEWSAMAPAAREAALLKAADLISDRGEAELLDLLIDESGSTINKARGEIMYTSDLLRAAAGEARRLYGDTFPNDNRAIQ